jgi:N-formylglutamate amidohydrolase
LLNLLDRLLNRDPKTGLALIFHIPHASVTVPPEARSGMVLTDAELAVELLRMTDRYTDEIFKHAVVDGDAAVVFPVSRLVVDPERFVDDDAEVMSQRGMGVVYLRRHDGLPLRANAMQKPSLIQDFYEPHHRALSELVSQHLRPFGRAIIIDCHSFPSVPLPYEQDPRRPEICVGTDSFHTPQWLSTTLVSAFEGRGYSVLVDSPFSGTIVPAEYLGRSDRVLSIMIEIRRDLYMDEETGERNSNFSKIAEDIARALGVVRQAARVHPPDKGSSEG